MNEWGNGALLDHETMAARVETRETHDTAAGEHVHETVQGRMGTYDGVAPHADLGDWGVEGDREWRQYLFSADESQFPEECPLSVTREATAPDAEPREAGAD